MASRSLPCRPCPHPDQASRGRPTGRALGGPLQTRRGVPYKSVGGLLAGLTLVQLNHAQREVTVKIVYYGPGLSGKTTNLQLLHARTSPEVRGRLLTVETHDDRTLFFDLLP